MNQTVALMLQHGWKIAPLHLIFIYVFHHHGRKIAHVLYIYPSTGTENNTELLEVYGIWSYAAAGGALLK